MRVLQVLPTLSAGGAESFITRLCCELQKNEGVKVALFIPGGVHGERGQLLYQQLVSAGVDVIGHKPRSMRNIIHIFNLLKTILNFKPDIVQANLFSSEVLCASISWLFVFNRVVFIRRIANTEMSAEGQPLIARILHKSFKGVVACSSAAEDVYRHHLKKLGFSKNVYLSGDIKKIENGVSVPELLLSKFAARSSLGLTNDSFLVCHVGRFTPGGYTQGGDLSSGQKAHDVILKSFAVALEKGLPTCSILLLVGDGPLLSKAKELAEQLGISNHVKFMGLLPDPWKVFAASDIFFFPSRYEGLPNALVEAASCGLPVIASNIPEVKNINISGEWILSEVDNIDGFSEGLVCLFKSIDFYKNNALENKKKFINRFSIKSCTLDYIFFYRFFLRR